MDLKNFVLTPDKTFQDAIRLMDKNGSGIVIIVDDDMKLKGILSDGDTRRLFLEDVLMDSPLSDILNRKQEFGVTTPITAKQTASESTILQLMTTHRVRQVPILDDDERLVGVVLMEDLVTETEPELSAVLMAGGFGTRLHPLTLETPKPMLELGGRPIMEHILEQLRETGIHDVHITTHYKGEIIADHFGDGARVGLHLDYIKEDNPLGTAGALGNMPKPDKPVLVMNGDIITNMNFEAFHSFHTEHNACLTMTVRAYEHIVPYGVIKSDGINVRGILEKPQSRWLVNAGIYILSPEAFDFIEPQTRMDMPELIEKLIAAGKNVICFPIHEYWRDIGRPEDFVTAEQDIKHILHKDKTGDSA